jgi:hypothetical protein
MGAQSFLRKDSKGSTISRAGLFLNQYFAIRTEDIFLSSWGEEQHLGFVVLPKLKNVDAMLNST